MSVYVQGSNPTTVLNPARNHAAQLIPLAETLLAYIFLSPLHQEDHEHWIYQSKGGANSYSLHLQNGNEYHFRGESHGAHLDTIAVYDRWTYKRDKVAPIALLRNRNDCYRFVRQISNPVSRKHIRSLQNRAA